VIGSRENKLLGVEEFGGRLNVLQEDWTVA